MRKVKTQESRLKSQKSFDSESEPNFCDENIPELPRVSTHPIVVLFRSNF